jgi:hypothetical protein
MSTLHPLTPALIVEVLDSMPKDQVFDIRIDDGGIVHTVIQPGSRVQIGNEGNGNGSVSLFDMMETLSRASRRLPVTIEIVDGESLRLSCGDPKFRVDAGEEAAALQRCVETNWITGPRTTIVTAHPDGRGSTIEVRYGLYVGPSTSPDFLHGILQRFFHASREYWADTVTAGLDF